MPGPAVCEEEILAGAVVGIREDQRGMLVVETADVLVAGKLRPYDPPLSTFDVPTSLLSNGYYSRPRYPT